MFYLFSEHLFSSKQNNYKSDNEKKHVKEANKEKKRRGVELLRGAESPHSEGPNC